MKPVLLLFIAILPAGAADLTGTWIFWPSGHGPSADHDDYAFDIVASGAELSGSAYARTSSGRLTDGRIAGDHFSFRVTSRYDGSTTTVEGTFSGNTIRFTANGTPMEGRRLESQVTSPVSVGASNSDVTGKWRTWFVGPFGPRPKMFAGIDLDLQLDRGRLTGSAHMGSWPGDAPISDAHYSAGHFTFTVIGQNASSSGYPEFHFEGTIHGKEMKLNMVSGKTENPLDGRKME